MSEIVNNQPRDLSRAAWMRSTGQVIMSRLADYVFADDANLVQAEPQIGMPDTPLSQAANLLGATYVTRAKTYAEQVIMHMPPILQVGFLYHTYHKNPRETALEAVRAQVYFPINFYELAARKQGTTLEQLSLAGLSAFLRRDDVATVSEQMLLAKNGFLQRLTAGPDGVSSLTGADFGRNLRIEQDTIRISDGFMQRMHAATRAVNHIGDSSRTTPIGVRPSSGCPIRHDRPHFTNSLDGNQQLTELAAFYDTSVAVLVAPRTTSVMRQGLLRSAAIIDTLSD